MTLIKLYFAIHFYKAYALMYNNTRYKLIHGINAKAKCEQIVKTKPKGFYCEKF